MWVGDKRFLDLPLGPFRISDGSRTRPAATFRKVLGGICVGLLCATTALGQASLGELNESIAQLAEEVLPGVVQIESNSYAPILGAGNSAPVALQSSTGSGVILDMGRAGWQRAHDSFSIEREIASLRSILALRG